MMFHQITVFFLISVATWFQTSNSGNITVITNCTSQDEQYRTEIQLVPSPDSCADIDSSQYATHWICSNAFDSSTPASTDVFGISVGWGQPGSDGCDPSGWTDTSVTKFAVGHCFESGTSIGLPDGTRYLGSLQFSCDTDGEYANISTALAGRYSRYSSQSGTNNDAMQVHLIFEDGCEHCSEQLSFVIEDCAQRISHGLLQNWAHYPHGQQTQDCRDPSVSSDSDLQNKLPRGLYVQEASDCFETFITRVDECVSFYRVSERFANHHIQYSLDMTNPDDMKVIRKHFENDQCSGTPVETVQADIAPLSPGEVWLTLDPAACAPPSGNNPPTSYYGLLNRTTGPSIPTGDSGLDSRLAGQAGQSGQVATLQMRYPENKFAYVAIHTSQRQVLGSNTHVLVDYCYPIGITGIYSFKITCSSNEMVTMSGFENRECSGTAVTETFTVDGNPSNAATETMIVGATEFEVSVYDVVCGSKRCGVLLGNCSENGTKVMDMGAATLYPLNTCTFTSSYVPVIMRKHDNRIVIQFFEDFNCSTTRSGEEGQIELTLGGSCGPSSNPSLSASWALDVVDECSEETDDEDPPTDPEGNSNSDGNSAASWFESGNNKWIAIGIGGGVLALVAVGVTVYVMRRKPNSPLEVDGTWDSEPGDMAGDSD